MDAINLGAVFVVAWITISAIVAARVASKDSMPALEYDTAIWAALQEMRNNALESKDMAKLSEAERAMEDYKKVYRNE